MPQQAKLVRDTAMRADQVRILAENVAPAVLVTLLTGAVFVFVHAQHQPLAWLLPWLALVVVVLAIRVGLARAYLVRQRQISDPDRWLSALRAAAIATGILWGAAGVLFSPPEAPAHQMFSLLVLSGIAAGAISTQAADYRSLVVFDAVLLIPVATLLLTQGGTLFVALGALAIGLLAFLLRAGHTLSQAMLDSLRLRYQNADLLATLERDKQQLDNRLGRILEDSSSEIYVFAADSLACLQVNNGAVRNLGSARQDMVGKSMLDVLVDMDRARFEQLAAPLRDGSQRTVSHHGAHRRADGSTYPVDMRLQLSDAEDPPVFVATALDVSEREANERVARERQVLMQSVLSSAPVALWALDMEGDFTFLDGPEILKSPELPAVQPGDNIFTAFVHHTQVLHDARRALGGESFSTDIEIGSQAFEIHYSPLFDDGGQVGAIGVALDISDRKAHEHQLYLQASFDTLTGLPNKSYLMNGIGRLFARARRARQRVGLLFLDLDKFKAVNDTLGHEAGDELLRQAATRIRAAVRDADTICRVSGDEFLVVVEDIDQAQDVEVVARKLLDAFVTPFNLDGREMFVSCSIGIALYPDDGESSEQLLQHADTAMYHAKSAGRSNYQFFTRSMREAAEKRMLIESRLRRALESDELTLAYQPKVDPHSGRVMGAEALLRWRNPDLGQVPPDRFIPVAEDAGLIEPIGAWVMETACREAAAWQALSADPVSVAVNVSSRQFRSERLLAVVDRALSESGLAPELLELEITEGLLLQDAPETLAILRALRERGVRLALDDFGTGYSSLSYLKRFPMQVLKIDRSFVRDLGVDNHDRALVEAIVAMAHSLSLDLVAEGVETVEQADFLAHRRVDLMQGYLFSAPVSADAFRQLLRDDQRGQRLPRRAGG